MACKKVAAVALAALVLTLVASDGAHADLVLNGGFEMTVNGVSGGKDSVYDNSNGNVNGALIDWSVSMNAQTGRSLTSIDTPGTATLNPNSTIAVYGPFPNASPNGGNFIQMDGDPVYSATISQTINGLTPGQKYAVSFYQAAGEQQGDPLDPSNYGTPLIDYWQVSFGSQVQNSPEFDYPAGNGTTGPVEPWEAVTLDFTATSTSEVLSFLGVGPTNNLPPIVFLDGVSVDPVVAAVPEPTTLLLTAVGLLVLGVAYLRQRRARLAVAA